MHKWIDPALAGNPEFQSALVRLAIWLFAVLYIGFGALTDYYTVDYRGYTLLFGSFLVLFLALLASVLWRPVWPGRRLLSLLLDISATSLCIYLTHDVVSPFYLLYIWIFISYGTRYGKGHLIAASLLSILAYTVLLSVLGQWSRYTFEVIFFLLLLIMLPLYQYSLLRKLHQARLEAEQSDRAKSVFLSSMTHELRTPLSGIMGMSRLLLSSRLDQEQRESVESIASAAGVLDSLIGEVLDLSRMDAGGLEIKSHWFDIRSLCRDVMMTLSQQALGKGLELICQVDPELPKQICLDDLRLRQILFNLLTNALKFTHQGEVELLLAIDQTWEGVCRGKVSLLIEVRDSGIGLDPSEQEKLFDRFWQADNTSVGDHGGIGLGCTITRRLIELMGGEISVESEKGVGSIFRVCLPLNSQACSKPRLPAATGRPRCALVFEASARMYELICMACEAQGIKCHRIAGVDEPMPGSDPTVQQEGVDFAILADSPGGEDVIRLGDRLRECVGESLPIIYLGYRERRLLDGHPGSCFMVKPFIGSELSQQIGRLFGRCRLHAEHETAGEPLSSLGLKVLIAEDNTINAKVLQTLLEDMGCVVIWARNGLEATQQAAIGSYDIAFIDLRMPHRNGLEFARHQRGRETAGNRLPIVALTANALRDTQQQCLEAGMDDFLSKPVDERQLRTVIERIVGVAERAPEA